MRKVILGLVLVSVMVLNTGCFSVYKTYSHNKSVDASMIQIQSQGGDEVNVRLNLLALNKGYFSAWQDDPAGMTVATVGDIGTSALIWWGVDKYSNDSHDTSTKNVTGDRNADVIVYGGSGHTEVTVETGDDVVTGGGGGLAGGGASN